MKLEKKTVVTGIMLLALLILSLFYQRKIRLDSTMLTKKLNVQNQLLQSQTSFYKNMVYESIPNSKSCGTLPNNKFLLDSGGKLINPLQYFPKNKHVLFYVYSLNNCNECIDMEVLNLKELVHKNTKMKVVILILTSDTKILKIKQQLYKTTIPIVGIANFFNKRNILEEKGKPFYFLLSSSLNYSYRFTPAKEDISFTQHYYSAIGSQLN